MRSLGDTDPRQVGPYRVLAGLETDETGLALLGGDPDGRLAVVKLVDPRLAARAGFPQRLAREVAAARLVSGVSVAPVVGVDPTEAVPWVALAFPPGLSVRETVESGVLLGEDAVLRLAAGLAGALTEIHRTGLVHRDLTPTTVLLTEDGVRVLDFGIARALGGRPATPADDVFSLGVVLHVAATGRRPLPGAEVPGHPVWPRPDGSLPPRVHQLLAACLDEDPLRRPTPEQLQAVIGPVPPAAWPAPVRSLIAGRHAEIARLPGPAIVPAPPADAPTRHIAPVPAPRRPAPPGRTGPRARRWKPDMWAVGSGGAVALTVLAAIVMFSTLTPDRPIRASERTSTSAEATGSGTPASSTLSATSSTTTSTTSSTTAPPTPPPTVQITGLAGKCMDIAGANTANGTPVQLHQCNGTDAQQWEVAADGTLRGLGKCLDVAGGATNDGATVQLHDCNGTGAQQWAVTAEGLIVNAAADKCLDVPASRTDDGTQLVIWTCHGEENQRWAPPS